MGENKGGMIARFRTVNAILAQAQQARPVRKADVGSGDRIIVTTEHSVYTIHVLEDATFSIRGGWFDRQRMSPVKTSIAGCTWGGSVIKIDIVAACGLRLEFGNRVLTSRIRNVVHIRRGERDRSGFEPLDHRELFLGCYGPRWEIASSG
jgi:hypothetical protein